MWGGEGRGGEVREKISVRLCDWLLAGSGRGFEGWEDGGEGEIDTNS